MKNLDRLLKKKFKMNDNGPSLLIKRLVAKIKTDLDIECDPTTFKRLRPGYWQRSNGAWSWVIRTNCGAWEIGSCDPVTVCVRKDHRLTILESGEITAEKPVNP